VQEELRPEESPALDQLVIGDLTYTAPGLDLFHAPDLVAREPLPHSSVLLGEDVECSKRVHGHHAEQSVRVRDEQVQREVSAPRVADRPRALASRAAALLAAAAPAMRRAGLAAVVDVDPQSV